MKKQTQAMLYIGLTLISQHLNLLFAITFLENVTFSLMTCRFCILVSFLVYYTVEMCVCNKYNHPIHIQMNELYLSVILHSCKINL